MAFRQAGLLNFFLQNQQNAEGRHLQLDQYIVIESFLSLMH
jgi:hypothetical protein